MEIDQKIENAKRDLAQAKARLQALEARASQAARKADTKRKIVLGGLLLDWAGKDPQAARFLAALLNRVIREQDRKAFQGWEPPTVPQTENTALEAPQEPVEGHFRPSSPFSP